jgi:hypothetical protein
MGKYVKENVPAAAAVSSLVVFGLLQRLDDYIARWPQPGTEDIEGACGDVEKNGPNQ